MNACDALTEQASLGVAPALRAVDCLANDAAAGAFGRLFGTGGALLPALTILLTLYIAFFAISLLTGRSRISVSALTPRMMTLGLVLTFATSWVAWQGVVWNLAVGAPDQLAGILLGSGGSATRLFADRLDIVFAAIQNAADMAGGAATAPAKDQSAFTPVNLMWLGALMLLLGTVGVLVTTRIALAVLLAVGPVFVVLALFKGTRGLFAGWLRGVVLTAITPLFVVVGGGLMLELMVPVIAGMGGEEGISGRAAIALFLVASVHVALMGLVLRVSATIVSGWQVFGMAGSDAGKSTLAEAAIAAVAPTAGAPGAQSTATFSRAAGLAGYVAPVSVTLDAPSGSAGGDRRARGLTAGALPAAGHALPPLPARRAQGIGSRFRSPSARPREMFR